MPIKESFGKVFITNYKCSKYKDMHDCPRETCINCTEQATYVLKDMTLFIDDKYVGQVKGILPGNIEVKPAPLELDNTAYLVKNKTFEFKPLEAKFNADCSSFNMQQMLFGLTKPISQLFDLGYEGQIQIRRHHKKRINKKWAKRYGYRTVYKSVGKFEPTGIEPVEGIKDAYSMTYRKV